MKNKPCKAIFLFGLLIAASTTNLGAAVITVDTNLDSAAPDNLCQLRDAIVAANTDTAVDGCSAGRGADLIDFSIERTAILLGSDLPTITDSLEIAGPGQDSLTIDGDDAYRMFSVGGQTPAFVLRGMTLFQGFGGNVGGCVSVGQIDEFVAEDVTLDTCAADQSGGAIWFGGGDSVEIRRATISNNVAGETAGAIAMGGPDISALIEDSVFFANRTEGGTPGLGGAMLVGSTTQLTIRRSTFSENNAIVGGSAIATVSAACAVTLENSTVAKNALTGVATTSEGGALLIAGSLILKNTVVAANTEVNPAVNYPDFYVRTNGSITTLGHNFVGSNEGASAFLPAGTGVNGDQVGIDAARLDPQLIEIADNGGPTLTMLPDTSSPLLDQGSCAGELADQRGYQNVSTGQRPVDLAKIDNLDDGCDIGAVELDAEKAPEPLVFKDGFEI